MFIIKTQIREKMLQEGNTYETILTYFISNDDERKLAGILHVRIIQKFTLPHFYIFKA